MIRYHGLPITPTVVLVRALATRHAMVSFAHQQQLEEAAEICQSIVLDNGAFSAWVSGKKFDFSGYAEWAEKWLKHPAVDWCVIPDVIDGSESENDDLLLRWPTECSAHAERSVPVYHMHESLGRLERLVFTYSRVALGSSGEYKDPGSKQWWKRMAEMMAVACDEDGMPRTKLHGLRMLDTKIFSHLPLASADSCNVGRNIGMDVRWIGPYMPRSKITKALVLQDRVEYHACARRWCSSSGGVQQNIELIG